MDVWHVFSLLGGLALFLYGMGAMGEGLELLAGNRMQKILERLTTNKLLGVTVGIVVTAIIQSSSATTVMVVGFVNSNLMNLSQAVNVIMGANVGTTVTGQLIALNVSQFAPLLAFVGIVLTMMKANRRKYLGKIIIGLGFLFMGLHMMSESMVPLRDSPIFIDMMQNISNPFLGILTGALTTAVLQSSSASIGILQALALQGLVPFHTAVYIVLGQNIGTCITSVLASIGTSRSAKRAAISHVLFNVIGTILFVLLNHFLPLEKWIIAVSSDSPMHQIANLHTFFNIGTTLVLLPFSGQLAHIASVIIPRHKEEMENGHRLLYVNPKGFAENVVMIANIRQEILRMVELAQRTFSKAVQNFRKYDDGSVAKVHDLAGTIHYLDAEVTKVAVQYLSHQLGQQQSETLTDYIRILSNLDRVGDYSLHIGELIQANEAQRIGFSEEALLETDRLSALVRSLMDGILEQAKRDVYMLRDIYATKYQIDSLIETNRSRHIERMKRGECGAEAGLSYDKFLSHVDRIASHLVQVAEALSNDSES